MKLAEKPGKATLWVLALLSAGLTIYNWRMLLSEGHYYPKVAVLGPAMTILFPVLALFPYLAQDPESGDTKKSVIQIVVALAIAGIGFFNWYLMSNYHP